MHNETTSPVKTPIPAYLGRIGTGTKIHLIMGGSTASYCGCSRPYSRVRKVADDTPEARAEHVGHLCELCFNQYQRQQARGQTQETGGEA